MEEVVSVSEWATEEVATGTIMAEDYTIDKTDTRNITSYQY